MGFITDLLKDIPLSGVLKERLVDTERHIAKLTTENAALITENAVLKDKMKILESGLQDAREEIARLTKIIEVSSKEQQQEGKFDAVEEQILQCFYGSKDDLTEDYFLGMFDIGTIRHHFDRLLKKKRIELAVATESPEYSITSEGRAHVIKETS